MWLNTENLVTYSTRRNAINCGWQLRWLIASNMMISPGNKAMFCTSMMYFMLCFSTCYILGPTISSSKSSNLHGPKTGGLSACKQMTVSIVRISNYQRPHMIWVIISLNHYDDDIEALSCPGSICFSLGRFSDPFKVSIAAFCVHIVVTQLYGNLLAQ